MAYIARLVAATLAGVVVHMLSSDTRLAMTIVVAVYAFLMAEQFGTEEAIRRASKEK